MYHFMPHCLPSSAVLHFHMQLIEILSAMGLLLNLCVFPQTNDFFLIGKLIAMSILQGGCGFPVFHPAAYNYLEETMWDK